MTAIEAARAADVPTVPGSGGPVESEGDARAIASEIGYPVLIKAAAGGGGRGMRVADDEAGLIPALQSARAEAEGAFGNGTLYIEKFVEKPRHVEIQILADEHGNVIHLGERDCSLQRRHQKLLEESPCPVLSDEIRQAMTDAAVRMVRAANYHSAGTVEFLLDRDGQFYFIEVNSRIQVEHPVTEEVTGVDLIKEMIRIAAGDRLSLTQADVESRGHAIEFRINAEDPDSGFKPSPGTITTLVPPAGPGVRWDSHAYQGYTVPPYYDSMVGKLIVHRATRAEALQTARRALEELTIEGIATTTPFFRKILEHSDFINGEIDTSFIDQHFGES